MAKAPDALCDELEQLIGLGPGTNTHGLARARGIIGELQRGNDYAREKAAEVLDDFEMWFTPRKWARFGDQAQFRARLMASIAKLRGSHEGPQ